MANLITDRHRTHINKDAYDILYEEAAHKSAEYIKKFIDKAIITDGGWWKVALNKIKLDGLCIELGVYQGRSINFFAHHKPNITWYGFDSFHGFKEDWMGGFFSEGEYSTDGQLPKVNNNVRLIKGFFKDTLPNFLKEKKQNISFLHVDCDTYESTKEALEIISSKRFVTNTIILFDEYISYVGWEHGEFKAWKEFVKKNNIKYKYEMFGLRQALVRIL